MSRLDDLKKALADAVERHESLGKAVERTAKLARWANTVKLGSLATRLEAQTEQLRKQRATARERVRSIRRKIDEINNQPNRPTVMFDAVTVSNIPSDAKAVGCYVGPSVFTCDAAAKQAPNARRVKISQAGSSTTPADVVDIEPGDATIETGFGWLKRKLGGEALGGGAGKVPKVYMSAGNSQAFISYAASHGVPRDKYRLWSAHPPNEHICGPSTCGYPQADGTQHNFKALGRDLDQSKLLPRFWD